jgi:hypothetical protein
MNEGGRSDRVRKPTRQAEVFRGSKQLRALMKACRSLTVLLCVHPNLPSTTMRFERI